MDEKPKIKHFTDLQAWQEGHKLVILIYQITEQCPQSEMFGSTNQIRRAVTSITANIAEGFSRFSYKDRVRFYYQSRGSISEVENFLLIIKDLKFISIEDFNESWSQCEKVASIVNGLINSTKKMMK